MTALAAARDTKCMGTTEKIGLKLKGSTTVYKGGLVHIDAGYLAPAATATGKLVVGRCCDTVVNSGADGAKSVDVEQGIFKWANGESIVQADVGKICYAADDAGTVYLTATGKSIAGIVIAVDSDGVWVQSALALSVALVDT